MKFERGGEIRACYGEAGYGIYAFVSPNKAMRDYYTADGENLYLIISKNEANIVDFTKNNLELERLVEFMKKRTEYIKSTMNHYIIPKINKGNYQRFGAMIEDFIRINYGNVDGWIVLHEAKNTGTPKGKQLVITNIEAFSITRIN